MKSFEEKSFEEREEDLFCLFGSLLKLINEKREEKDKILILDREIGYASYEYAKLHKVYIVWSDELLK